MKVDPLPPIPSPPAHLWRQFRVKALPGVTFVLVLGAVAWLWSVNLSNPLVMGTAHGSEAELVSPQDGKVQELRVVRFQEVKRGDILAVINPASLATTSNTLALIRAETNLLRAEGGFDAGDRIRYAQFQLDWMDERTDLLALQAQLAYAEAEHRRVAILAKEQIVDQSVLDIAVRDLSQAQEQVQVKTEAVEGTERALRALDPAHFEAESPHAQAAIALAEQQLRLAEAELQPVVITAPIDGRVSRIEKLEGTRIASGEPILTIASPEVDYILGYIGQPIRIEPTLGMKVQVRSRGLNRSMGQAQITRVGPRIELFNAPLRVRGMGNAQERGLPILVSVPSNMKLRPGELVDLSLVLERKHDL